MRLIVAAAALMAFSAPAYADIKFVPTPDNGYGPIFTMWRVDTTGQQRTQLCEFYRSSYSYQTGVENEFQVTIERSGTLDARFRRCLFAQFSDN